MNDEQLLRTVGSWLKDTDEAPRDLRRIATSAVMQVPQTYQRGRWWPLPTIERPTVSARPGLEPAAALVPASSGPPLARGFTMFSALKFITAGVIVALFGGFLLAGGFTAPPADEAVPAAVSASPTPQHEVELEPSVAPTALPEPTEPAVSSVRTDILPGVSLLTLELEPGILQVLDDGVREPDIDPYWHQGANAHQSVYAGQAGTVWLTNRDGFYRLGGGETHEWPGGSVTEIAVTADDRVWARLERNGKARVRSFDGRQWKTHLVMEVRAKNGTWPWSTLVADDGTVWRARRDPGSTRKDPAAIVSRLEGGEWQQVGPPVEGFDGGRVHHVDDGVWIRDGYRLARLDGGDWEWQAIPDVGYGAMAFAPGGIVWHVTTRPHVDDGACATGPNGRPLIEPAVARFDGSAWSVWEWDSDVAVYEAGHYDLLEGVVAAPDGSLWLPHRYLDDEERNVGITRFDGVAWQHFLPGRSVTAVDFGPDGTAWLQASSRDEPDQDELIVIFPEAIEAEEARPATRTTAPPLTIQPPEISVVTRSDVLPGVELSTREIEPGVLRLLHDGVRRLWLEDGELFDVVTGPNGEIWINRSDRFLRLGDETASRRTAKFPGGVRSVAPDGMVWTLEPNTITSFDGKRRVVRMPSPGTRRARAVEIAPDGTVWAVWVERDAKEDKYSDKNDAVFGYLDDDRWRIVDEWVPGNNTGIHEDNLTITETGEILGITCTREGCGLSRYSDGAWEEVLKPAAGYEVSVGADGTAWLDTAGHRIASEPGSAVDRGGSRLRRFHDGQWESWEPGDGSPDSRDWTTSRLWVSPDGDLWVNPDVATGDPCASDRRPGGLIRFDGTSSKHYLQEHSVDQVAFAPDGAVWVIATDRSSGGSGQWFYVITPEAVAAIE